MQVGSDDSKAVRLAQAVTDHQIVPQTHIPRRDMQSDLVLVQDIRLVLERASPAQVPWIDADHVRQGSGIEPVRIHHNEHSRRAGGIDDVNA